MTNTPALAMSPIVAGLWRLTEWNLDVTARVRWIEQALELGISTFDHADIYGDYRAEALFGEALKAAPALRGAHAAGDQVRHPAAFGRSGPYRLNHYDTSPAYVRAQVEQSLRNLHADQLDLVLIHRPDYLMDAGALAADLCRAQRAKARWRTGASPITAPASSPCSHQHHPLVTNQLELSPLTMHALDDGTLDQAQRLGRRPMIWSPLGGGRLFSRR